MKTKFLLLFLLLPLGISWASQTDTPIYKLDDFVVKSSPLSLNESEKTQATTVLASKALDALKSETIAQTLIQQPGISQTYYGPNANRPIIRGLDGFRVNILENGMSSFDLSATSADHAVTINPLLVNRIEVLRGSSSLIYGSNAIGGVINVFDTSIPNRFENSSFDSQISTRYSSVNNGISNGGIFFYELGDFIFQVNGSNTETEDYDTPSFEPEHEEHHHHVQFIRFGSSTDPTTILVADEGEFEPAEEEDDDGPVTNVANTHSDIQTMGLGGSYNHEKGFVGVSYSDYDSSYGVPNHESSIVSIDRKKTNLQSYYEFDSGFFDNMNLQIVHGDYTHSEEAGAHEGEEVHLFTHDGSTFTEVEHDEEEGEHHDHHATFIYEGIDSKLIFSRETDVSSSALSLSYSDSDMKIEGEESYLAAMNHYASENEENDEYVNDTAGVDQVIAESTNLAITNDASRRFGLGLMQKKDLSTTLSLNGGVRYDSLSRDYDALTRAETPANADFNRDDSTLNGSIGFVSKNSDSFTLSGNLHYSERIPETSELYSSGAHHATESFEIGNPNLENEQSIGVEFAVSDNQGAFTQKLSLYYNDYDNFIYQSDSGFKTGTNKWREATDADVIAGQQSVDDDGNSTAPDPDLIAFVEEVADDPATPEDEAVAPVDGDYIRADFEELSIREYVGVAAQIYGLEYEFNYSLSSNSYLRGFADYIQGKNKDATSANDSLPRVPPWRFGLGYYLDNSSYRFNLNATYHGKQDDIAEGEEITDGYTVLNARLGYFLGRGNNRSEIYCKINNITEELGYVHTSFLKSSAPIPGRNIEVGLNYKF